MKAFVVGSESKEDLGLSPRIRLRSAAWVVLEYLAIGGFVVTGGVHGSGGWLLSSFFVLMILACIHAGVEYAVATLRGAIHPAVVVAAALLPMLGSVLKC